MKSKLRAIDNNMPLRALARFPLCLIYRSRFEGGRPRQRAEGCFDGH